MLVFALEGVRGPSGKRERGNIPNSARDSNTFVPIKAGQRSLSAFMMAFNILTTAPGFVTRFFRLVGVKKLFAAPENPFPSPLLNACASAATASNSGARFFWSLSGSCVTSFLRNEGSFSY